MDSQTGCWEKDANLISAEVQVIKTSSFALHLTGSELSYARTHFRNAYWTAFIFLTSLRSNYNYYFYFTDESCFI